MGVLGTGDRKPVLPFGGVALRVTSGRDVPARGDELFDTRLQDRGGHDDRETEVLAPVDLHFSGGLGVDAITLGEVPDLHGDNVGKVVLGEIAGKFGDELGRNLRHVNRGRTLGELERNQAVLADLKEGGMHLGGVGSLYDSGLGPGEAVDAHVSLETNSPGWDDVVAMSSVDADVVAHVVALDDRKQGLHVLNMLVLETGLVPDIGKAVIPATQSVSAFENVRGAELDIQNLRGGHISLLKRLPKASDGQRVEGEDVCSSHGCRVGNIW